MPALVGCQVHVLRSSHLARGAARGAGSLGVGAIAHKGSLEPHWELVSVARGMQWLC